MAMGTRRKRRRQHGLWISAADLPTTAAHPFYRRLNALLDEQKFDEFVEEACRSFYAETMGRPSLTPGMYFRLLLVGYFEGIDAERGIAWRAADSLAIRQFLHLALDEAAPDHSTISRTRRLIDLETHRAVFTWIQQRLTAAGLLKGKTVAIDATTLEANAAMRSIVRRDTGEDYQAFLTRLAKESGIETPTREDLARLDRKRKKKKTSNTEWTNPHDPDAKVTKMKDGRTHLAHKAEHAVDVETGAMVAVTLQGADQGDTTTIVETATAAAEQVEDAQTDVEEPQALEEIVADKGYHSNQTMIDLDAVAIRSYIAEPNRGRRAWSEAPDAQAPVYGNRRRIRGRRGRHLMRRRGETIERSFAHLYDTGGMRRTHLRGHTNILKRLLIHAGGFNLGLVMRHVIGIGTPRGLQGRAAALVGTVMALIGVACRRSRSICRSCRQIAAIRGALASSTMRIIKSSTTAPYTTGCSGVRQLYVTVHCLPLDAGRDLRDSNNG
jgi:transposase